jgi:hypothetical protein
VEAEARLASGLQVVTAPKDGIPVDVAAEAWISSLRIPPRIAIEQRSVRSITRAPAAGPLVAPETNVSDAVAE